MELDKKQIKTLVEFFEGNVPLDNTINSLFWDLKGELNLIESKEKCKSLNDEIRKGLIEYIDSNFKVCCCHCCKKNDG